MAAPRAATGTPSRGLVLAVALSGALLALVALPVDGEESLSTPSAVDASPVGDDGGVGAQADGAPSSPATAPPAAEREDAAAAADGAGGDAGGPAALEPAKTGRRGHKRDSRVPPTSPEETDDPRVAEALRAAPPVPPMAEPYEGWSQAMRAAKKIRRAVPHFYQFRAAIPLGSWVVDPSAQWRIQESRDCMAKLREQRVWVQRWEPDPEDPDPPDLGRVPNPVVIKGRIDGVRFKGFRGDVLVSCELASRLPVLAKVLREHEVRHVLVSSSFRPRPRMSFHSLGMGLDIPAFGMERSLPGPEGRRSRRLVVRTDFVETPERRTCDPEVRDSETFFAGNERGKRLLSIACDLFETGVFSSVLTPNYNEGHRDHFHIDVRPDDPRHFLR